MHEASLVEYTMRAVERSALKHGMNEVTEIHLVIGKLKVAVPELLQKCFRLMKDGTMFEHCTLDIEEKDVLIKCRDCGTISKVEDLHIDTAPCCGSRNVEILQGNELLIKNFRGRRSAGESPGGSEI